MLIIDNYDSFTYNIVQYIKILGIDPIVIKNDTLSLEEIKKLNFSKILISPGWGKPNNSGITMDVIDFYQDKMQILGVCLGMQCIAQYYGASIVNSETPYHGKTSEIYFNKNFKLFDGLKQSFCATRYHSLVVQNITPIIEITGWTKDNIPMALKIKEKEIYGVQFHPESILTEGGIKIFENFINL